MKYSAILFDLEGTIIDTEDLWDECSTEFLRRHGHVYDRDALKHQMMGGTLEKGAQIMRDHYGFEGDPVELAKERREIFAELLETEVTFEPGFEEFFARVQRGGYQLAIATSMERPFLARVEHHLHLSKYFGEHIYSIADIGHIPKPDPAIFLHAAKQIGAEPAQCIGVEDAPHGVTAVKAAGMYCIALTHSVSRARLEAAGADQTVGHFDQIKLP